MSEKPLAPLSVQERVLELLASNTGPHLIAKKLREEGVNVTGEGVRQHILGIVADPKKMALLTLYQRAQVVADAAELRQLGWEVIEKIRTALQHVNINSEVLEMKDVKLLTTLTPLLKTWWSGLVEISEMLKKEQFSLNLTQVNIEQVNTVNGQLLTILQDALSVLPDEKRHTLMERVAELSVVDTTGTQKS